MRHIPILAVAVTALAIPAAWMIGQYETAAVHLERRRMARRLAAGDAAISPGVLARLLSAHQR
jgi:hypothetical protein